YTAFFRSCLDLVLAAGFYLSRRLTVYVRRCSLDQTTSLSSPRFSYPITENLSQQVYYRIRQDEIDNIDFSASRFIKAQEGDYLTSSVGHVLTYDRRDDRIEPTTGYVVRLAHEVAGLGGTEKYFMKVIICMLYYTVVM